MTEAAQRKPAETARRLPVSAAVLWTGLALGTAAAIGVLMRGVMLPLFGESGFLAGALNVAILVAVFAVAGVAGTELTRRHHRAVVSHAVRHGRRGTSAAYRGARRHGGRGAAFVAVQARARWAAAPPAGEPDEKRRHPARMRRGSRAWLPITAPASSQGCGPADASGRSVPAAARQHRQPPTPTGGTTT